MAILVADVGGTTSRLAIADGDGRFIVAPDSFANCEFGSFYDVLAAFSRGCEGVNLTACCVAMAGPVGAGYGKLTNLDWQISSEKLKTATKARTALVINDLTALGHALARLQPGAATQIVPKGATHQGNGQSLVIGVGTGFNICPVKQQSGVSLCLEAEAGHAALPATVHALLTTRLKAKAAGFTTVEALFSGRGLARLHRALLPDADLSASEIVQAYLAGDHAKTAPTLELFATSLAAHCRSLMLQFMPLSGVYFAGSVARAVFATDLAAVFREELNQHSHFKELLTQVPIAVINDDAAALLGCVAACQNQQAGQP